MFARETEVVVLTRSELYEKVWAEPMQKVAPTLGMSDVGLKKLCKRHLVPTPPLGYWAKKAHGKRVHQPALPEVNDANLSRITFRSGRTEERSSRADDHRPIAADPAIDALILAERSRETPVLVAETLRSPHPLVENTRLALGKARPNRERIVQRGRGIGNATLDINTTKESLGRALRIMNAVLIAFQDRNYSVGAIKTELGWRPRFQALGEEFDVRLRERLRRVEHPEKERRWERYELLPTGDLELRIELHCAEQMSWHDGKRKKLEDQLPDILIGLLLLIDQARTWRKELEEWQQRYRARERRKQEEERLARIEQDRVQDFERIAAAWSRSKVLHAFLAALREEAIRRGEDLAADTGLAAWLAWAERYARRLDPLYHEHALPEIVELNSHAETESLASAIEEGSARSGPRQPR